MKKLGLKLALASILLFPTAMFARPGGGFHGGPAFHGGYAFRGGRSWGRGYRGWGGGIYVNPYVDPYYGYGYGYDYPYYCYNYWDCPVYPY